ncbi:MAG TPA: hypothetical protein VJX92_08075 [Methylomirabilota bacterium]|nr:hypothetical protein [Methylomirabilota bacterium]
MLTSFLVSIGFCTLTVCGFLLASEPVAHWFVVPVWLCGVLIGRDAVDWLRGRVGLLDPAGIIGLIGVHFFFVAPLLHVAWGATMLYVDPPPDWRPWLGGMAIVNAAGLVLYGIAREHVQSGRPAAWRTAGRRLRASRLLLVAGCGMAVSAVLQAWVYASYGGISGYIDAFTESFGVPEAHSAFANMGWIFTLSESFPILALLAFAAVARRRRIASSWVVILAVLIAYFGLKLLFGGLRGSRSNTIWGLFWAVGIVHLWIRPLSRRFIIAGLCLLVAFMYAYGFYKGLGRDVVSVYEAGELEESGQRLERTFQDLVLGDFARADIQAFLLYRLWRPDRDYSYAWGRTYLGTVELLIPRRLWPDRPPTKVLEGTEAQTGVGSYDPETWVSSRVYGLAGETMLNFGPLGVPLAFLAFGWVVGHLQRFHSGLRPGDARRLTYPFILNLCFTILLNDSDILLFMLVKDGLVPLLVVWFASRAVTRAYWAEPAAHLFTLVSARAGDGPRREPA